MRADYRAVLDACVLIPMPLADTLLRMGKLHEQAAAVGVSLPRLLQSLARNVPGFVEYFCEEQGIDLAAGRGTSQ